MSHFSAWGVLAIPVALSMCAGLVQFRRALSRPVLLLEEFALAFAWSFNLGATFWLEAFLTGTRRVGYSAPWTWLTAAHFSAAGFGALTVSALLTRTFAAPPARRVMNMVLVAHPLAFAFVAAGISGSQGSAEFGALLYLVLFGAQLVAFLRWHRLSDWVSGLLGISLCVPVLTLVPAFAWALGEPVLSLGGMIRYHGLVNALGHVGIGLAVFAWSRPRARVSPLKAPLSKWAGRGSVSPNVSPSASGERVRGLTDNFSAYDGPSLSVGGVHPEIVDFYQETDLFELDLRGHWHWPFRTAGTIFTQVIAPRLGQLGLPAPGHELTDGQLASSLLRIEDDVDGRRDVRGWIRTWKGTNRTLYIAAYSEHESKGVRYMNIAFPLPGRFNLTSILHLENGRSSEAVLTSLHENHVGDQGVYLVRNGRPWRLPLDETITVYPADEAPEDVPVLRGSTLVARHEMWMLGLRYLTMHYQIRRRAR